MVWFKNAYSTTNEWIIIIINNGEEQVSEIKNLNKKEAYKIFNRYIKSKEFDAILKEEIDDDYTKLVDSTRWYKK